MTVGRGPIVGRDGRAKAYRPLPAKEREVALAAGLAAYDRGDFFEAHELLEPAWMGTDDLAERALLQGLIKLAAAYVHSVRGNPAGIARNLEGARNRLEEAHEDDRHTAGLDLDALLPTSTCASRSSPRIQTASRRRPQPSGGPRDDPARLERHSGHRLSPRRPRACPAPIRVARCSSTSARMRSSPRSASREPRTLPRRASSNMPKSCRRTDRS